MKKLKNLGLGHDWKIIFWERKLTLKKQSFHEDTGHNYKKKSKWQISKNTRQHQEEVSKKIKIKNKESERKNGNYWFFLFSVFLCCSAPLCFVYENEIHIVYIHTFLYIRGIFVYMYGENIYIFLWVSERDSFVEMKNFRWNFCDKFSSKLTRVRIFRWKKSTEKQFFTANTQYYAKEFTFLFTF